VDKPTWESSTAMPSFWRLGSWLGIMWHGRATLDTGRAMILDVLGSIFFISSNHT